MGIAPIPSWSVAPSTTRSAMYAPIRRSMSPMTGRSTSWTGSSTSIARSIWETWMNDSPSVRGIALLSWAMTVLADPMAACIASTDVPSEQNPCESGGVTLMNTASRGSAPVVNRAGTSDRNTGTKSARPSLTARRALGPMNSARWRKCGAISGARCGPGPSVWRWATRDVPQLGGARDERGEEHLGGGGGALDVQLLAGADPGDGFLGRDDAHGASLGGGHPHGRAPDGPSREAGAPAGSVPPARRNRRNLDVARRVIPPAGAKLEPNASMTALPSVTGQRGDPARMARSTFGPLAVHEEIDVTHAHRAPLAIAVLLVGRARGTDDRRRGVNDRRDRHPRHRPRHGGRCQRHVRLRDRAPHRGHGGLDPPVPLRRHASLGDARPALRRLPAEPRERQDACVEGQRPHPPRLQRRRLDDRDVVRRHDSDGAGCRARQRRSSGTARSRSCRRARSTRTASRSTTSPTTRSTASSSGTPGSARSSPDCGQPGVARSAMSGASRCTTDSAGAGCGRAPAKSGSATRSYGTGPRLSRW